MSGIVLLIVLVGMLLTDGIVLLLTLMGISLIGLYEFYRVFKIELKLMGIVGYLMTILYFLNLKVQFIKGMELFFVLCLVLNLIIYVFVYPKYNANTVFAAFFGFVYVSIMISAVYETRMLTLGVYLVWLIFISSWGCDTCAYCIGVLFGKHKLAPVLSPKKSIEGAVGGIVGASLIAFIYGLILRHFHIISLETVGIWVLIVAIGSVFSQIGDLSASGIKRNFDIKDYGRLIPGHGGILDRFDSVFFTAPFVFYLCLYILG